MYMCTRACARAPFTCMPVCTVASYTCIMNLRCPEKPADVSLSLGVLNGIGMTASQMLCYGVGMFTGFAPAVASCNRTLARIQQGEGAPAACIKNESNLLLWSRLEGVFSGVDDCSLPQQLLMVLSTHTACMEFELHAVALGCLGCLIGLDGRVEIHWAALT